MQVHVLYLLPLFLALLGSLYYNHQISKVLCNVKEEVLLLQRELDAATDALEAAKADRPKNYTVEAQELLNDLTTKGKALVYVTVLNQADIFLRRP